MVPFENVHQFRLFASTFRRKKSHNLFSLGPHFVYQIILFNFVCYQDGYQSTLIIIYKDKEKIIISYFLNALCF